MHWRQATWYYDLGRLDSAYVDFLLAFTIIADVIPRCQDFPTLKASSSRNPTSVEFGKLKKVCIGKKIE